jgi:hypothetical protein
VSTNRTLVDLIAAKPIPRLEDADLVLDSPLFRLEACELGVAFGKRVQILGHQRTHRLAQLGSPDPRSAVDIVGHRHRDILHSLTVSQFL